MTVLQNDTDGMDTCKDTGWRSGDDSNRQLIDKLSIRE